MKNVDIYIDGSCINNGMPNASAGWAFVAKEGEDTLKAAHGKLPGDKHTNNRAELFSLLKALEWIKENEVSASIYSDSKIVIDGLLGDAQRKANRDIWEQIEEICPTLSGKIANVSHIDRELNKEADELAKKSAYALFVF